MEKAKVKTMDNIFSDALDATSKVRLVETRQEPLLEINIAVDDDTGMYSVVNWILLSMVIARVG